MASIVARLDGVVVLGLAAAEAKQRPTAPTSTKYRSDEAQIRDPDRVIELIWEKAVAGKDQAVRPRSRFRAKPTPP